MATYTLLKALSDARGTFYYAPTPREGNTEVPRLYFVSDDGRLRRIRMAPYEIIYSGNVKITKSSTSSYRLDGAVDTVDVRWNASGSFVSLGARVRVAQIASLPPNGFSAISVAMLEAMAITGTSFPEDGQSGAGHHYAVKTSEGNFAKVRIYKDATSNETRMEWVTYRTSNEPELVETDLGSPTDVIVKEVAAGDLVAYVCGADEDGNGYVYAGGVVHADGFGSPKQMVFTPDGGTILLADGSTLWAIDANLDNPFSAVDLLAGSGLEVRGVAVTKAGDRVYLSGVDGSIYSGTLRLAENKVHVDATPGGAPKPFAGPLSPDPLTLHWADEAQTALLATLVGGAPADHKLLLIPLSDPSDARDLLEGVTINGAKPEPRSIEVIKELRFAMTSDAGVGELDTGLPLGLNVPLGIGHVPFQAILDSGVKTGLADTVTPPELQGYFYKVKDVPFGGTLHLMLNHAKAHAEGYHSYQIRFLKDGEARQITASFSDLKWDGSGRFVASPVKAETVGSSVGCYPVRDPDDLWYNPHLGALLNTTGFPNGVHTLEIKFLDATGNAVAVFSRDIFIENAPSRVKFLNFLVNGQTLNSACGASQYVSKEDPVTLGFEAGYDGLTNANYNLRVIVGAKVLAERSGVFDPNTPLFNQAFPKLRDLMGKCNIATITASMSISPRVINGYNYIGGASTSAGFSLVPASFDIDEP
ncbi:hypothetical protein [Polyangium sorediatum]|uniref:Ig-like domain-containing protein n=1 Tax=Polyangium sorediatum TaxID=889274 RepID=A0ABT6NSN6_9BACT|nr:hypothetical protein [Polyangium sorediatum]MDI1431177.1 hypothetical protein [Polyangium sorediatum]